MTGTTPTDSIAPPAGSMPQAPLGQGRTHSQPALVGAAFLLFATADAFSLPFLPLYAESLFRPDGLLGLELARGLPITAFWLAVAAAQLTTGRWERGRNRRTLFLAAVAVAAAGLAGAALAGGVEALAAARAISGFGYGMVMILSQDYLLRAFGPRARTMASGLYIGLFFGGYLFGALGGGVLAGLLGYAATFWCAAVLTGLTGLLLLPVASHVEALPPQTLRPWRLLRNGPLLALVFFAAIPARIVNGGFLYLLAPVYLHGEGLEQSAIGQVIMVFSVIMATTAVPWARLVDRTGRPLLFTILGMLVTGAAMLVVPAGLAGPWGMVAAMALLGTGQAIGMSPQVTVLFRVAEDEVARFGQTSMLGVYRVCERVGLMTGPVLASWLLGAAGIATTLLLLGGMMMISAAALAILSRPSPPAVKPSSPVREEAPTC